MKYLFNVYIYCHQHVYAWYFFVIILLLPGCGYNRTKHSFDQINRWSQEAIHTPIHTTMINAPEIKEALKNLSREKAFEITLRNNTAFLAQLEEIGIKSSDLIQAGFFSNPNIESIFLFPKPAEQTDITITARFSLSDFWQVPLRKKIAEDELLIKTYQIMQSIIKLRQQTYTTFYRCIFEKMRYELIKKTVQILTALQQQMDYRLQFGLATNLDGYLASIELYRQQSTLNAHNGDLSSALFDLQYLLGINEPSICINPQHMLAIPRLAHSAEELFVIAQQYHPTILLHTMNVKKAMHTIHYEESRIFDNVAIGLSYNRDFDKETAGIGPFFSFDLPLFNTNYGNIQRARYELKQARYNLENSRSLIQNKINSLVIQYSTLLKTIEFYPHHIFPTLRKAIEYAQQQMNLMQLPANVLLDTQLKYLQAAQEFIDYLQEASTLYAKIEKAVGKSLLS